MLFQADGVMPERIDDPTAIPTPLGVVRLSASVDGRSIDHAVPTATYRVSRDGWIAVWQDTVVELAKKKSTAC